MADICKNEETTKKKKRPRLNSLLRNKDDGSLSLYDDNFAESYMKKLSQKLNENSFYEMLSILEQFQTDGCDTKILYDRIEIILKDQEELRQEFLCFLEPYQAFECGKLMLYYEMFNIKQFVRNLLLHFKRQPQLLNKFLDKLCCLAEHENIHQSMVDETLLPFLQKNSALVQQFFQLLADGKPPDWCFSSDDSWEDFNIDSDLVDEETFEIHSQLNDTSVKESENCIYHCKEKKSFLCPVCNVKFINGRMYVANGKMLHPAQIFFDPKEQTDQIRRLSEKSTYFVPPSSKPRNSKKADTSHKDTTDERLSPIIVGTESEEELGENDLHRRKRKRKSAQRLKIRFDAEKKKVDDAIDNNQADDTAPSNDEISCDEGSKEDTDQYSCDEAPSGYLSQDDESVANSSCINQLKEVVKLGDMELNFSETGLSWSIKSHTTETNGKQV